MSPCKSWWLWSYSYPPKLTTCLCIQIILFMKKALMVPLYWWVRNLNLKYKGLSQTTGTFQNGEWPTLVFVQASPVHSLLAPCSGSDQGFDPPAIFQVPLNSHSTGMSVCMQGSDCQCSLLSFPTLDWFGARILPFPKYSTSPLFLLCAMLIISTTLPVLCLLPISVLCVQSFSQRPNAHFLPQTINPAPFKLPSSHLTQWQLAVDLCLDPKSS